MTLIVTVSLSFLCKTKRKDELEVTQSNSTVGSILCVCVCLCLWGVILFFHYYLFVFAWIYACSKESPSAFFILFLFRMHIVNFLRFSLSFLIDFFSLFLLFFSLQIGYSCIPTYTHAHTHIYSFLMENIQLFFFLFGKYIRL